MGPILKYWAGGLAALIFTVVLPCSLVAAPVSPAPVVVQTVQGKVSFKVELALTPDEQQRGLMHRRSMPADAGMLFIYPRAGRLGFWMKNTLIALDIIFIGDDNKIVDIHENAQPLSLQIISPTGPARTVLEINGGLSARMGIAVGDQVRHPNLDGGSGG